MSMRGTEHAVPKAAQPSYSPEHEPEAQARDGERAPASPHVNAPPRLPPYPTDIVALQRALGNQATQRIIGARRQLIQRLKEGEEIPSIAEQARHYFEDKQQNQGSEKPQQFLESRKNRTIRSSPYFLARRDMQNALRATDFFKHLLEMLKDGDKKEKHEQSTKGKDKVQTGEERERGQPALADWKDRGGLQDRWSYKQKDDYSTEAGYRPLEDAPATGSPHASAGMPGDLMRNKLARADQIIKTIVEPGVLRLVLCPRVIIIGDTGHRSYVNAKNNSITVGEQDDVNIIVHEVGHYLEANLPSDLWYDVMLLREYRHNADFIFQSPNRKAVAGDQKAPNEARYRGSYPATGEYTSRVYEGAGLTEVVSKTLEFFASAAKLETLIDNDPVQAAVILRHLRPNDRQLQSIFDRFRDYLPNEPLVVAPRPAATGPLAYTNPQELHRPLLEGYVRRGQEAYSPEEIAEARRRGLNL